MGEASCRRRGSAPVRAVVLRKRYNVELARRATVDRTGVRARAGPGSVCIVEFVRGVRVGSRVGNGGDGEAT